MSVFAVASLHGSPGATTLAIGLAAAWPTGTGRDRLVVEADPDGGVLAARFASLRADRTLADAAASLAVRRRFDRARLLEQTREMWDSLPVLVAPPSAEETQRALQTAGDVLATGLAAETDLDTIVDVGRLTARSPAIPFARRAVVTALVLRPRFEDVALLTARARELRHAGIHPQVVVVGSTPYAPSEVAEAAELPSLAVLPDDARAAAILSGGDGSDRRLQRSLLWRAVHELASQLPGLAAPPVIVDEPAADEAPGPAWPAERDPAEVAT